MKELKEALAFAIELSEATFKAVSDGKFDWTDALEFRKAAFMAGDAVEGASKIVSEIKNLGDEGQAELMAYVKSEFDIADDILEARIEGALKIALGIAIYASTFQKGGSDA